MHSQGRRGCRRTCEIEFCGLQEWEWGEDGDGCYDWRRKAVHTIVVRIVNAFNAGAGVRVEEEDDRWWVLRGGMMVVL